MKLGTVALAAVAATALTVAAAQAAPQRYSVNGSTAAAEFYQEDGCIYTHVSVWATDRLTKQSGSPITSTTHVFSQIYQFDNCQWQWLVGAYADQDVASKDFSIKTNLSAANLVTTLNYYDYVIGSTSPVSINLAWTAIGPANSQSSIQRSSYPGVLFFSKSNGSSRAANVTGTISYQSTNWASYPRVYGNLTQEKNGIVQINHH